MNSHDILVALRDRYPLPEWAAFEEVSDGTGSHRKRAIDFYAVSCWPSSGYRSLAIEVKVSRSDFMREINDPTKREPWESRAGECWFATPAGLVDVSEVPAGWGLMEVHTSGVVRVKRAAEQRRLSQYDVVFAASLLRCAAEQLHEARRLTVQIEDAKLVAADVPGWLQKREDHYIQSRLPFLKQALRGEVYEEMVAEFEKPLRKLIFDEMGYRASGNPYEALLEIASRANEARLKTVRDATRSTEMELRNAVSALNRLLKAIEEGDQ